MNIFLKKQKNISLVFLSLVFLMLPLISLAQPSGGIIQCDGPDGTGGAVCNYDALLMTIERLLEFLVYFAGVVAVIMFVWAGAKLVLSGGNPTAKEDAKKIIWSTVIGFVFVLAAWLIVNLILSGLGSEIPTPIG